MTTEEASEDRGVTAELAAVFRRWVYCRCTYARAPTAPCRCTETDIRRAERETRAATVRWEERLAKEQGRATA